MPATEWGWEIAPEELRSWTIEENDELLVVNKPAFVVCHPSKRGPWSSLVGAAREYLRLDRVHLPSRLDRETSGVVVLAKTHAAAARLQNAATRGSLRKLYWAVLSGCLPEPAIVAQPLGRDPDSPFGCRQRVSQDGRRAETEFTPVARGGGYTLVRVVPRTGRMHQIRVHASWLGHPIAGDKLYGPDPCLMMEFVKRGFTERLRQALPLPRHALHAAELAFRTSRGHEIFRAPLALDLLEFCRERMDISEFRGATP